MVMLTVRRAKVTLIIFLSLYTLLGVISLVVWQYQSYTLSSHVNDNILDVLGSGKLINKIDPSWYARTLLYNYFLLLGVSMLIYAIFGAVSIYSENRNCLKGFGFLLLIIASMKVPIIAYTFYQGSLDIVEYAKADIWNNFQNSFESFRAANARNFVQNWHSCCGVYDYQDYKNHTKAYPKSCCRDNSKECELINEVIQDGCVQKIADSFAECFKAIGILSFFILLLEVPAVILVFQLPRLIKKRKRNSKSIKMYAGKDNERSDL